MSKKRLIDERIGRFARRLSDRLLKPVLLCLLCAGLPAGAWAQTRTLAGVVKDTNGVPVFGVTVMVPGTTKATATALDGTFSLAGVDGAVVLETSFIGYETTRQSVPAGTNRVEITISESATRIEDVVVVGYGTQKKATLTGSVVAVGGEELLKTKSTNVQNMMTGKLPGVRVVQKTSEPGVFNNQFDIRGFGAPLVVVDGVPRGDFERMDPNDIESISVLKDASAAIYGVKASNGVVLITTKKGTQGRGRVEYSMYYGMQFPSELLKPVGLYDRYVMLNEKTMRDIKQPQRNITDEMLENARTGKTPSNDWYKAALVDWAPQQQHNVSISGGSEAVDYYANFGYMDQQGFFRSGSFNYDRYNLRANLNANVLPGLKVGVRLSGMMDQRERPQVDAWELFKFLWRTIPDDSFYANDTAPYYTNVRGDIRNVLAVSNADYAGYKYDKKKIFNSTVEANYKLPFLEGLTARASFSYDHKIDDNTDFRKEYSQYTYGGKNEAGRDIFNATNYGGPSKIDRFYGNSTDRLWNAGLHYDARFNEAHKVGALVLYEESHSIADQFGAARNLLIPLPYLGVGQDKDQRVYQDMDKLKEFANRSLIGRLEYGYKDRYLVEGDFRYDGSSRFLPGKRWSFYWGAMAAWRLSEEAFIKDNLSMVDNLKLRASYSKLGDDSADFYQFMSGYSYPASGALHNNYGSGYYFGNTYVPGLGFRGTPNPNITWYDIDMLNAGIDADLWNGLFGFSVDLFQRDRDDLFGTRQAQLPSTFGSNMPKENLESDRTRGFEVALRHRNRIGEVTYGLNANLSMTRTMNMTRIQSPFGNSDDQWRKNESNRYNDIWFGWGSEGRYTSYEQIAGSTVRDGNMGERLPGDYIYQDWNSDGVIDDDDKYPIAITANPDKKGFQDNVGFQDRKTHPLMYFAFGGDLSYKGFDFDFLFQGSALAYVAYGEQISAPLRWDGNAIDMHMDRWRPVDPTADPFNPATQWTSGHFAYGAEKGVPDEKRYVNSRAGIQNSAYLRLKSVTLGYTLPQKWVGRIGMNNLRVYVSGYNLLTLTKVKGVDPEKPAEIYGYMYPLSKTVNFGASVRF